MKKKETPPGTRGLVQEYLKRLGSKKFYIWLVTLEKEIADRIGPGNSVIVNEKIVTSMEYSPEGKSERWLLVSNKKKTDSQDSKAKEFLDELDELLEEKYPLEDQEVTEIKGEKKEEKKKGKGKEEKEKLI